MTYMWLQKSCLTCDTLKLTILSLNSEGLTWVYLHQDYLWRNKTKNLILLISSKRISKSNLKHEQSNMSAQVNSKPHDQSCFVEVIQIQDLLRFLPLLLHSSSVNKSSIICVKSSKQLWRADVTLTMYWTENHPVSPFRAFLWCSICRRHVWMQMQATRGDKILTIHDSTRFSHSNSFFQHWWLCQYLTITSWSCK